MNNEIYLIGEVGWELNLETVVEKVNESDKTKPLNVHIHSPGGSVYDGLAIYNYLKGLDQEVHTISAGLVASIASIIFLAGKKETRKINKTDSFLIHLPAGMAFGGAEEVEKTAEELRKIEGQLGDIYEKETDITKERAQELMKMDEMMDVDELKEMGFVAEIIEFKAVANFNKHKDMDKPLTKKEAKGMFDNIFAKYFPKKNQPTNKIVQDASGEDIDFTDLEDGDTPKVGDMATIDGTAASGDKTMPDGRTFVFEAGELTEIKEAEGDDDMEALKQEIIDLKAELATANTATESVQAKLDIAKADKKDMKRDFKELRNTVTSHFDSNIKKNKKEPTTTVNSDGVTRTPFNINEKNK